MPITSPITLSPINQKEFAQLDYDVMRHAFECQSQLGRLCDEVIYQNDLTARLQAAGLPVRKEVPVTVSHRDFAKTYSLDLVVANAGIYELKTASALVGEHEAQLLNYLFLCGAQHGKLINFRSAKVQSRFINTSLTQTERRQFDIEMSNWQERKQTDQSFLENLIGLLKDWGCCLDLALYTEALIHFAGGEDRVVQRLPLARGDKCLGTQRWLLLDPETAFWVTALTEGTVDYEHHLRALLCLTPLRAIQWVNLARRRIQLTSLTNDTKSEK
jgi:GxxExxY protein